MAQKYWIDEYFVDQSRNQITRGDQTTTLPPKALAVLTYLSQHQGDVVSHDAIMTEVWKDTVVSPNSLQRCITQLRKTLGDDSKQQSIIKTHARQGYSLERKVNWQHSGESQGNEEAKSTKHQYLSTVALVIICFSLLTLGFVNLPSKPTIMSFDRLTPVTASDEKEGNASYSPDGKYILFHRYTGQCKNHLWAKDLTTQKEHQLTETAAWYGSHSFSPDQKQLVFLANEDCDQQIKANVCWNMVTLNLVKALQAPQSTKLLKRCEGPKYNIPHWLNDGSIAMLQKLDAHWKVVRYSSTDMKRTDFYAPNDKQLYSLAYSAKHDLIAIIGINKDGEHILDVMDMSGNLVSSASLKRPAGLSPFEYIYPKFDAIHEQLFFATKKKLFTLSYQGDITEIPVPLYQHIYNASMHPNGDKLVATYGTYDTDIAQFSLDASATSQSIKDVSQVSKPLPSIARSIFREKDGYFQPHGRMIAFLSERSGSNQLWLTEEGNARQLSDLALETPIGGFSWSSNGQSIILAANGQLLRVSLDGKTQTLATNLVIKHLFKSTVDDTLLLTTDISGSENLVTYQSKTEKLTILAEASVEWAAMSSSGVVVYLDDNRDYWRVESNGPVKIEQLGSRGGQGRFVMAGNMLYGVDKLNKLWRYDLDIGDYQVLRSLGENISNLSDIKRQRVLVTQVIAAKKEVIELTLGN